MFFYDDSDCSGFRENSPVPGIRTPAGIHPASWTGLTSAWSTMGLVGHVFDYHASLTRVLKAVEAAHSTTIACKYCQKSMKINENQ